jgi:hypothetical protein
MFSFFIKIRIVPLTIFAAVLMLSFKVSDIIDVVELTLADLSVSKVNAQAPAPRKSPNSVPSLSKAEISSELTDVPKKLRLARVVESDPTLFAEGEIKMLQQLTDRRVSIEARSRELILREGLLGAAEKRIDKKLLEMARLKKVLQKKVKARAKVRRKFKDKAKVR